MSRLGIVIVIAIFMFSTAVFATHIYHPKFAVPDPTFITFPATLTRPATGNLTFTISIRYDIFWGDFYYFNKTGGWTKLVAPGTRVDREYILGPANVPISIDVDKLYNNTMILAIYGCDRISLSVWECSRNPSGANAWILINPDFIPICGNSWVETGEQCDDRNFNNSDACKSDCTLNICGDRYLRTGVEQCDDGNTINGDGCSSSCSIESAPTCGNGVVNTGETCDDGNTLSGDGCSALCKIEYRFDSCPQTLGAYIPPPGPIGNEFENEVYFNVLTKGKVVYSYDGTDFTNTYTKTLDTNATEFISRDIYADAVNELDRSEISGKKWDGVTGDEDVFVYNLATKVMTNITSLSTSIYGTDIHGNYVVYDGGITNLHDIFLYNRGAQTTTQLTSDAFAQQYPKIYGDYIVYLDRSYPGGNWELTLRKISDSAFKRRINNVTGGSIIVPDVEISGDYVSYSIVNNVSTDNRTLYLLRISTNQTKIIDRGLGIDFHMDHGLVVYDKGLTNLFSGNFSVFSYNISSGILKRLINSTAFPSPWQVAFDEYNMVFNKGSSTVSRLNSCSQFSPACGNAFTDDGEQCDDGNIIDTDLCRNICIPARCGDSVTSSANGEQCDDGNTIDTDACTNSCRLAVCGDNITSPSNGEQCDDGNTINTDSCTNVCRLAVCGDGFLRVGSEQCDDGNIVSGDGCSASCNIELQLAFDVCTNHTLVDYIQPPSPTGTEVNDPFLYEYTDKKVIFMYYETDESINLYLKNVDTQTSNFISREADETAKNKQNRKEIAGVIYMGASTSDILFVYNTTSMQSQNLSAPAYSKNQIDFYGNHIVYSGFNSGSNSARSDIYVYNKANGQTTQLTNDNFSQIRPQIFGDYVVYSDNSTTMNKTHQLTLRNISNLNFKRTIPSAQDTVPIESNMYKNYIVYKVRNGPGSYSLMRYNIDTNQTTLIDSATIIDAFQLDFDRLVYIKRAAVSTFYSYNITSGVKTQLTGAIGSPDFSDWIYFDPIYVFYQRNNVIGHLSVC